MKQQGLGLIELMIAITLGSLLTLAIAQVLVGSQKTFRVQQALADIQENARFAVDILSRDIRTAGDRGCNQAAQVHHQAAGLMPMNRGVHGYEYDQLPAPLLEGHSNNPDRQDVIDGTDVLVIVRATSAHHLVNHSSNEIIETTAATLHYHQNSALIISDCRDADIFWAGKTHNGNIGHNGLSKQYDNRARLAGLSYNAYYIGRDRSSGYNNLYRRFVTTRFINGQRSPSLSSEALLEGVEAMQIEYGERLEDKTVRYGDASMVNMANVEAVRIHLLFTSLHNNLTDKPQTYYFHGQRQQAPANDKRLYRPLTFTVALRTERS